VYWVVLQQTSVDGDLSVWENMELHGRLHHIPNPQRQRLINQWLEYVELAVRRDSLVKLCLGNEAVTDCQSTVAST